MKKKKTILLPDNLNKPGDKKTKQLVPVQEAPNSISSIEAVKERIGLVNQLYQEILEKDKHYGKLPGTEKDTLYKPGAEKLNVLFKLVPKVENEEIIELGQNHREYRLMVGLYHKETGQFFGDCIGSCSTMESKYRYRYKSESTNIAVDKEYWSLREQNLLDDYFKKYPKRKGLKTEKIDGRWYFVKKEKAENPDIADVYNTVYKMAYKRAFVGATIIATGVSDIFTQDLDDNLEPEKNNHNNENQKNLFSKENNNSDSQNNEKSNNNNSEIEKLKKEVLEKASLVREKLSPKLIKHFFVDLQNENYRYTEEEYFMDLEFLKEESYV